MRCFTVVLLALYLLPEPAPAWKADIVKAWALNLGTELWQLSEKLTKSDQIRHKYKQMNASVKEKDGKKILESSLRSVSTMMKKKVNAVKCIHATAKILAEEFNYDILNDKYFSNFSYCSAKYSNFTNEEIPKDYEEKCPTPDFAKNNSNYVDVELERDSHFYDINVDTNQSCVQVPTNIYYKERDPLGAILWSESLNEVFLTNYRSDPSLSWQYFGSSHGILRLYPAMPWNRHGVDTYDCRVQSWYIEAATCSKDVIILFDVSGSMTGFKNYVARRTLVSLLDTLSNNDYVNVYTVNKTTNLVVDCFEELVQATHENVRTIREKLDPTDAKKKPMPPLEGNANLTMAYIQAFETLRKKATKCDVSSTQGCNQMVMLITDYVPGNFTEVFEEYNRVVVDNKTYIPVRVFTYLIGKEVTNVAEIQWMACSNRGYYVHIHSVEEVQQQVLKYINVIARPMILENSEPPPTWTHANIDKTRTKEWSVSKDIDDPDEDKLVTSVAIPAFHEYNNESKDAILLGVAGTDVPIDSIAKLAQPHQLGVNGYSFIVSNNGYLLLHPLLITSRNGKLQDNYNSVDFVEVEQVDDGKGARELGDVIKQLRHALVEGEDGKNENIAVLYHYDVMRRIARVKHNYFYSKLEDTPFSMGISLPKDYGNTELYLKDNPLEVKKGQRLTGINVTDYFRFNYRVHPEWVYCKYHYLEGHETDNAEIETWQFLVEISKKAVNISKTQYSHHETNITFDIKTHCGNGTTLLETDDYYCNEDLVKQLVFDAKLSTPYFEQWSATDADKELAKTYNVDVRFIGTASGLTRWDYIFDDDKNEQVDDLGIRHKKYNGSVFGDRCHNSIEETWYKAAVLQHMVHKESLVISTQLPTLDETIIQKQSVINDGDITVTATYAIFYKDGKSETPASVVGFEFSFQSFYDRFIEITKQGDDKKEISCEDDRNYDCYLVDSSGYFVIAKHIEDVGKFLGVLHPYVMQSFIDKQIYDHVEVFNYQALCPEKSFPVEINSAWSLSTSFNIVTRFFKWLLVELLIMITNLYNKDEFAWADTIDDYSDLIESTEGTTATETPMTENITEPPNNDEPKYYSCDHRISLYILNQSYFHDNTSPVVYEDEKRGCHPPYWAAHVVKTNLLLLVVKKVDTSSYSHCKKSPDTKPVPTKNSTKSKEPCHKLDLGALHRRRLEGCYTYHDKERNITACGKGSNLKTDFTKALLAPLFIVLRFVSYN